MFWNSVEIDSWIFSDIYSFLQCVKTLVFCNLNTVLEFYFFMFSNTYSDYYFYWVLENVFQTLLNSILPSPVDKHIHRFYLSSNSSAYLCWIVHSKLFKFTVVNVFWVLWVKKHYDQIDLWKTHATNKHWTMETYILGV